MKFLRHRRLLVLLACVTAVAAAACSSSGSSSAGASAGTSSSASQIVIGDIGAYTGSFASGTGGFPAALNAWESYTNANGGIAGHPVKIITDDIGSASAGASLTDAETLIKTDHVVAIIDLDGNDGTWLPYAAKQGVPVIGAIGQSVAPLQTTDSFPINYSALSLTYSIAAIAKTYGPKMGVAYCAEAPGCAQFVSQFKLFGASLGVSIGVAAPLSSAAPDYTAFCQELIDAHVNSYILLLPTAASAKITAQCYQQGVKAPQLLLPYATLDSLKSEPAYNNDVVVDDMAAPFWDTAIPAVKTMRAALSKYTSGVLATELDNVYLEYAWASGQLIAAAIAKTTGDVTSASLKEGLFALKGETLGGLTTPLTYDPTKPTSINCYFHWKITNGQFVVPPGGSTPACAPASLIATAMSALPTAKS
jgi:branched-chain amino acid transport system substrate-binding protein